MSATPVRIGDARARLLRLFARIVAEGLHPSLLAEVAGFEQLADLVDPSRDPDQEAADHQDLFGFRVPPYAGVFLDVESRIGGRPADDALRSYAGGGWQGARQDLGPDHLSTQLEFLGHCAEHGLGAAARAFLDGQLLSWLAGFSVAVSREPFPSYRGLIPVLEEAVREVRASLGEPAAPLDPESNPEDILADPKTGVREIASWLVTPARSGIWLGRGDVERMGREAGVPRGFGGRALMLGNLLRSAAEYGRLGPVLAAIDRIAVQTASHWKGAPGPWSGVWTARIDRTRTLIAAIEDRIRREAAQGSGS